MKKLIIIQCLLLSFIANALTRKEMIQDKLGKIGISQKIIDETVKLEYKFKEDYILETDEELLNPQIEQWESVLKKDERNYYARDILSSIYLYSGKQDLDKAKKYIKENEKYYTDYENTYTNLMFYTVSGDGKEAEKYYNKLKKDFKNIPEVLDLVEVSLKSVGVVNYVNSLDDENYENFLYEDSENKIIRDFPQELEKSLGKNKKVEQIVENDFPFSKSNLDKAFSTLSKETKKIKDETEKREKLIKFFKDEKNKLTYNVTDDILRGLELKLHTTKMSRILLDDGAESAVKYYLENVDVTNLTEEEVLFNKDMEVGLLNLAIMYLGSSSDEKVINEYKNKIINSRTVTFLEKLYREENNKKIK